MVKYRRNKIYIANVLAIPGIGAKMGYRSNKAIRYKGKYYG